MSRIERSDFLAMHGKSLIDNGYNIVPIPPKSKAPGYDGWQKTKATPKQLSEWTADGLGSYGIGILTKDTPAIDLDILDERVAKKIVAWCELNFGVTPIRVGRAPKALLVFRTDKPFRKMKTGKYEDEWGDKHEIEVLGDGQQFVAYGLHKDTGNPYIWTTEGTPVSMHCSELPLLTLEDIESLFQYFEQLVREEGWKKVTNGMSGGARSPDEPDDPFADVETVVDLPAEEIRDRLMLITGAEEYDRWVHVGMALFHQFGGDDEGLALWHEWSEVADNYDAESLERHWRSFDIQGKKRAPVTARLIIKLAKEAASTQAIAKAVDLRDAFFQAKDQTEWREVCAKARRTEIDSVARAEIAEVARKRYSEISGSKLPIVEVRKAIAYELTSNDKTPKWCQDWVFDATDDRFFHVKTKMSMSIQGFNTVYSRQALTRKDILERRTAPSSTPADLAMNVYKIPEVFGRTYAPGRDTVFSVTGVRMANMYPEYQIPALPKELTPRDKRAIQTVKNHVAHLIENAAEQRLMLNWLAWIVQNPGKLLKWAMVLQGVEGDGKSFYAFLLRTAMGVSNVRMLNASVLESNFNGWAIGQCVLVIEEPRLQGHNKYDVINRIKPLITNAVIPIHAKGKEAYDAENTSNYFLPTNFRDALPLTDNDRRYCVLFSRWQNREDLAAFVRKNPTYYVELYRTIEECGPALRKWLVEHEIDDDFPSQGDAPRTTAHAYMVNAAKPELIQVIQEIIEEGTYPDITEDLVNATALPDATIGRDVELPQTQGINRFFEHNGYVYLGRIKIDGGFARYWSRIPAMFKEGNYTSPTRVRNYIKKQKQKIQENEL